MPGIWHQAGCCCVGSCSVLLWIDPRPSPPLDYWDPGLLIQLDGRLKVHQKVGWVPGCEYEYERVYNLWAASDGVIEVIYWDDAGPCAHRLKLVVNGSPRNWDSGLTELIDTRTIGFEGPRYDSVTLSAGDRLQLKIRNVDPDDADEPCITWLLPWREVVHDDLSWRTVGEHSGCRQDRRFYKLTKCFDVETAITDEPLRASVGKAIMDIGSVYWRVAEHGTVPEPVDSYAWEDYPDCPTCLDCGDEEQPPCQWYSHWWDEDEQEWVDTYGEWEFFAYSGQLNDHSTYQWHPNGIKVHCEGGKIVLVDEYPFDLIDADEKDMSCGGGKVTGKARLYFEGPGEPGWKDYTFG